jgi:hypothetical protein
VFIESVNRPGHFDQVVLKEEIVPLEYTDGEGEETTASEHSSRRPVSFENYHATHRATICRRSAYSALLRVDISHAVVDGESVHILLRDLSQAYLNEDPAPIAISYRDFVSYQQRLSADDSNAYWSGYLAGAQPCFFPTNGDHLGRQDLRAVVCRVNLDPAVFEQFCGKLNVTIANLCQVAWALVLRSYTGADDVCFSYVSSGRQAPVKGIDNMVGAFVNTMIFRAKMSGTITVAQALAKAKDDFVEGLSRQGVFGIGHGTGHGTQSMDFSRLRGNTIMSCQRRVSGEVIEGSGLGFEVLDAINPSEVSYKLPQAHGRKPDSKGG